MKDAIERLDALMNRLIEADQTGSGIEPLEVAAELGAIRELVLAGRAVLRVEGGQQHFRCERCGTISHGQGAPVTCSECGNTKFFAADIEQPLAESGAG